MPEPERWGIIALGELADDSAQRRSPLRRYWVLRIWVFTGAMKSDVLVLMTITIMANEASSFGNLCKLLRGSRRWLDHRRHAAQCGAPANLFLFDPSTSGPLQVRATYHAS